MIKIKYRFSFYRQTSREKVRKISAHDPSRHVPIVRWLERIAIRSWRPKGKGFRAWVNIFRSPGSLWQCQHRSKSESWTAIVANQMRSAIAWGWNAKITRGSRVSTDWHLGRSPGGQGVCVFSRLWLECALHVARGHTFRTLAAEREWRSDDDPLCGLARPSFVVASPPFFRWPVFCQFDLSEGELLGSRLFLQSITRKWWCFRRIISVAASRDRLVGGYASLFDSHLTFRLLPKKGDKALNNKMPIRNLFLVRSKEDQTRSLGSQVPAECGLAETIFIANRTLILGFRDSAIWQRHFGSGVTRLTSRKDKGCTRVEHFGVVIFSGWSILQPPSTIRNPLSTPSHPTPKGRRTRVHD